MGQAKFISEVASKVRTNWKNRGQGSGVGDQGRIKIEE
jgi:hypothetical protein